MIDHPEFSHLVLDTQNFQVSNAVANASAKLTAKEFRIFQLLYQAAGSTLQRSDLVSQIWGAIKVGNKTLDVHLHNLRRKIRSLGVRIDFIPHRGFGLFSNEDDSETHAGGGHHPMPV